MKKLFIIAFLLLGTISARANTLEVNTGDKTYSLFSPYKLINGEYAFLLSLDNSKITNKKYVNNLAYLANEYNSENYLLTISEMILESVNPSYDVYIKNSYGDILDNKVYKERLTTMLTNFDEPSRIHKNKYTVDYKGSLTIDYIFDNISNDYSEEQSVFADKIIFKNFSTIGENRINFTYDINITDNYITANHLIKDDFYVIVNVVGRKVEFHIDNNKYNMLFKVMDIYNNVIEEISLNKELTKTFYIPTKAVKIVDYSRIDELEKVQDINIDSGKEDLAFKIRLVEQSYVWFYYTLYHDILNDVKTSAKNNFTIYDINYNELYKCKNEESCSFYLKKGKYIIVDKVTNSHEIIDVTKDSDHTIKRYNINGLISKRNITKIMHNNEEIVFHKKNDSYIVPGYLDYDTYDVCFEDACETINLHNNAGVQFINSGVFYVFDNKENDNSVIIDKNEVINDLENNIEKQPEEPPSTFIFVHEIYLYKKED